MIDDIARRADAVAKPNPARDEIEQKLHNFGRRAQRIQPQTVKAGTTP